MQDYEKLGLFYLGKLYDLETKQLKDDLLLYDSKDLVTHAVVVGMTGSGKTGLCVDLIEEAAMDGVPSIVIDPKGDLTNLMLEFPHLRAEDFLPWINPDEARQKNLPPEAYAAQQAQLWRDGLAKWGQPPERIQRLLDAAEFRIYTPASSAGIPVSILNSFNAPPAELLDDGELLRERVAVTVTSLLGLIGVEADPVQSREYILLSNIIETTWRKGQNLDLATLIQAVQNPPLSRIGVLDLETFYPAKERFALMMALNNLLASPGFSAWLEGQPLDIAQILYTPAGKPRVAIFSIAHLGDSERMFFVSLLLNQVLGWMRAQPGTTSLRAILYMDEIFGYMPPSRNPPSKQPFLTLLKQARAYGLGLVLATQNPVDLDYKGLSNAGTWWIGRLQTERDKARLLDGLEGAAVAAGSSFDRAQLDTILSGLGSRVFLMNNTHDDAPVVMQTRWAMSYLCGPLTREQIRRVMAPYKAAAQPAAPAPAAPTASTPLPASSKTPTQPLDRPAAAPVPVPVPTPVSASASSVPPAFPPDVPVYFLPIRSLAPAGFRLVYRPGILGAARVTYADAKTRMSEVQSRLFLTPLLEGPVPVDWQHGDDLNLSLQDLERIPHNDATFAAPSAAVQAKALTGWTRDLTAWIYASCPLELLRSPSLGQLSQPGESEKDFRVRLGQLAREQRDQQVEALRQKYAVKFNTLQDRLRRAQQNVDRQKEQARTQQLGAALSIGSTLLGALTGRRGTRATTSMYRVSRSMNEKKDVNRAEETAQDVQQDLQNLQQQFDSEVAELTARGNVFTEPLEKLSIRPRKTDIAVQLVALAWTPYWQDEEGTVKPAW